MLACLKLENGRLSRSNHLPGRLELLENNATVRGYHYCRLVICKRLAGGHRLYDSSMHHCSRALTGNGLVVCLAVDMQPHKQPTSNMDVCIRLLRGQCELMAMMYKLLALYTRVLDLTIEHN
jgi:hypothetical protein